MELDLFGIKIGGGSGSKFAAKTTQEYKIKKQDLIDELGIEGKVTFINYDYKEGVLIIRVEER